jgi:hypothetical protein
VSTSVAETSKIDSASHSWFTLQTCLGFLKHVAVPSKKIVLLLGDGNGKHIGHVAHSVSVLWWTTMFVGLTEHRVSTLLYAASPTWLRGWN